MAKRTTANRMIKPEDQDNQSGMSSAQWNYAIRLQCAVRDAIGAPVSLLQALRLATEVVLDLPETKCKTWRTRIEAEESELKRTRADEQERIAQAAGGPLQPVKR
jgi:hypothetical protein